MNHIVLRERSRVSLRLIGAHFGVHADVVVGSTGDGVAGCARASIRGQMIVLNADGCLVDGVPLQLILAATEPDSGLIKLKPGAGGQVTLDRSKTTHYADGVPVERLGYVVTRRLDVVGLEIQAIGVGDDVVDGGRPVGSAVAELLVGV